MKKSLHNRRKELAGEKNASANLDGEKITVSFPRNQHNSHCFRRKFKRVGIGKAFFGGVGEWRQIKPFLDRRGRHFFFATRLCVGEEKGFQERCPKPTTTTGFSR